MSKATEAENTAPRESEHAEEEHPQPRGALLMTLIFLVLITVLWWQVYIELLSRGGIPQ